MFDNSGAGSTRFIDLRVLSCGTTSLPSSTTLNFSVKVTDTTLAASRWTVNGYRLFTALQNISDNQAAVGNINYFDESGNFLASDPFNLAPGTSRQIVHLENIPIGGVIFGGVRINFSQTGDADVRVEEYEFRPDTSSFLVFGFR